MHQTRRDQAWYLTTSEVDDGWQLSCVDVGYHQSPPGSPYPPHPDQHPPGYAESLSRGRVLSEYQIVYIAQGRGQLQMGGQGYSLEAGTAFCIFPGIPHAYGPDPQTGWSEYWVGFRGPYADLLCRKGFFSPQKPLFPQGLGESGTEDFRQILSLVQTEPPGFRLLVAARIIGILAHLAASERSQRQNDDSSALVTRTKIFFADHLQDHSIDLQAFSRQLRVSYSAFSAQFLEYTGLTPYQYYLNLKINRAKELLLSGLSVKEVAFSLGFESEFYFSRIFKKKTGSPPSRWR